MNDLDSIIAAMYDSVCFEPGQSVGFLSYASLI